MKINLDKNHILNSDNYCYWITVMVKPTAKSKTKEPYERRVSGYTGTFEQCVDSFIECRIRGLNVEDYKQLVKEINQLKKEVRGWKTAVERKK